MKKAYFVLVAILCLSCTDDDDREFVNYNLDDFSLSIIPFEEDQVLNFTTASEGQIAVNVTERFVTTVQNPRENEIAVNEFATNNYVFELSLRFDIQVGQIDAEATSFGIVVTDLNTSVQRVYNSLNECDNLNLSLEGRLTDIEIGGVTYNDVFVLNTKCNVAEDNDFIETIIYSPERGIEYVSFYDGSFYKQN